MSALSFQLLTDAASVERIAEDWRALAAASGKAHQLFQTFDWCHQWQSSFIADRAGRPPQLAVFVARRNDQTVLVWPLIIERQALLSVARELGDPVSQYGGPLIAHDSNPEAWLPEAIDRLMSDLGVDVISMARLHADDPVIPIFADAGAITIEQTGAPYADLTKYPTIEDFRNKFGKNTRRKRRRQWRLLEEQGKLAFETHTHGPAARDAIEKALEFKVSWLEQRGLLSRAYTDSRVTSFWRDLAEAPASQTKLHVSVLKCSDVPVAIEVGLRFRKTHVAHIGAFSPEYERFSPGILQMESTVGDCIENGFERYDLLPPNDAYKLQWADDEMPVVSFTLPMTLKGRAFVGLRLDRSAHTAKAYFQRLPLQLRRPLVAASLRRTDKGRARAPAPESSL